MTLRLTTVLEYFYLRPEFGDVLGVPLNLRPQLLVLQLEGGVLLLELVNLRFEARIPRVHLAVQFLPFFVRGLFILAPLCEKCSQPPTAEDDGER